MEFLVIFLVGFVGGIAVEWHFKPITKIIDKVCK